jgi:hypothetical protein
VSALAKWAEVITCDLPAYSRSSIGVYKGNCTNDLPSLVDDMHICGQDAVIDSVNNILGYAGPLWVRKSQTMNNEVSVRIFCCCSLLQVDHMN